jgi:peptidoglycan hydrolase-like protein with peptidoglycan-binding domain
MEGRSSSKVRLVARSVILASLVGATLVSGAVALADSTTTTSIMPATTTSTNPVSTTTLAPRSVATSKVAKRPAPILRLGSRGSAVLALQRRLASLGYWLGRPDGIFGDSTQQAVYALQKTARLGRDGVVGPLSAAALARGVRARPRSTSGNLVEIDLGRELLMIVRNGKLLAALNTSTGGGYTYVVNGVSAVATTPIGRFHIIRQVNGLDISPLGELWRPKYFVGGFAIHGDSYVPPMPVSHGCVRVSDEAINWIWAANLMPLGTRVWVY